VGVGDPSLRLKNGSGRDDATEGCGQKFKLSSYRFLRWLVVAGVD
jgi:hypothetical protein